MYSSLAQHDHRDWLLYYLCMDQYTYDKLYELNLTRVVPISMAQLIKFNGELEWPSKNRPWNEFCWLMASQLLRYVIDWDSTGITTYIDSDILFHDDPAILDLSLNQDENVGIIRHRHNVVGQDADGAYNVGTISFRPEGIDCLKWWADAVLHRRHPELDTCGDQKYLDRFQPMFGSQIRIMDEHWGHAAPWNYRLYQWDEFRDTGYIWWGSHRQKLIFTHFSRFQFDPETGQYDPTGRHYKDHTLNGEVFNIPAVAYLQELYAAYLGKTHEIFQL